VHRHIEHDPSPFTAPAQEPQPVSCLQCSSPLPTSSASTPASLLNVLARAPAAVLLLLLLPVLLPHGSQAGKARWSRGR